MAVHSGRLEFSTQGNGDVIDLTEGVESVIRSAGVDAGMATVFVPGATAAVTTMEFEPGGIRDLKDTLDRLVPPEGDYEHNRLNHDTNSHAHLRAAIVGPSESVPIESGRLVRGTWQQLVLLDFDDRPRRRSVTVTIVS